MSFIETPRFPANLQFGFSGGPKFSTDIVDLGSGFEQRNRNWLYPKGAWRGDHAGHNRVDTDTLIAFFRAAGGAADGFRFKDWTDYLCPPAQGLIGATGLGTGVAAYQLYKYYVVGSSSSLRPITKPVSSTIEIYKGGVKQTSGYSLNSATGVVTFTVAPTSADTITWLGEFDVPARFASDVLDITTVAPGLFDWNNVEIVEIRI